MEIGNISSQTDESRGKVFKFKQDTSITLNLDKLYKMYYSLNLMDTEFLSLLYLTSQRFREYCQEHLKIYVQHIKKDDNPNYEDEVRTAFYFILEDFDVKNDLHNSIEFDHESFTDFIDQEMKGWIKWSYNKYDSSRLTVHLLRYIILSSMM